MNVEYEKQLEASVRRELNALGELEAPPEIARRVMRVIEQRAGGNRSLIGMMVESYLQEGNQPIPKTPGELRYGISITDACISWETTERMLRWGCKELVKNGPIVAVVVT